MKLFDVYPLNDITIERGQGSYVWDKNGQKYLDLYGGHAVISIGHSHPHYTNRIKEQLDKVGFYSNSVQIPQQEVLASLLGKVSDKKEYQLFLCNSGAEANENAIKLASFHTGRKKVVAFSSGFHGRTSLAVAATDNPSIIAPVNETDNILFLPFNDVTAITECFAAHGDEIAAVIVEGIQGVGGINIATDEFLMAIKTSCEEYGALCIADEVQCGYGRSGSFFAFDKSGLKADIYTIAKGMGNGFPIGGIVIAPHIQPKHGMLGTTFGGNHLACSAAIAVLEVIEKEKLFKNAEEVGVYIMNALKEIPELYNVRGKGLMIGFDVTEEYKQLRSMLLSKYHIFTGVAKHNVIRLLPALNITKEEVDEFIASLKTALSNISN